MEEQDNNRRQPARREGPARRQSGKMTISQALSDGEGGGRQRSLASVRRQREKARMREEQPAVKQVRDVVIPDTITVQELANRMAERAADVVKELMKLGIMATVTQNIDAETAELVTIEFGHKVSRVSDSDIEDGMMYFYRIRAADYSGNWSDYSEVVQLSTLSNDNANVAERFVLHQNYPNPFNPRTNVRYDLPEEAFVDITVYDMFGNTVKTLVDEKMSSGFKSVQWNAKNNQGQPVSAGVYVYTIEAGKFRQTKKMILLK